MAKPDFNAWKVQTLGHKIDLDNQSFDCVDVSKSWAQFVYNGQSWQKVFCWGNAKDLWNNAPSAYWDRVQDPRVGDIVCMGAGIGGGYGHTGVVVEVNGGNITIYQQNTFTQQAVYTGIFNAHASYIQGYLRPKAEFSIGAEAALQGFQRVASYAAKYRSAANSGADLLQTFVGGDTYDFKGFVHGEVVDGNDVWFVGKYTGGYVWSGAFTDVGTHDLPDLTPAKAIEPFQRQVGSDAMNYRRTPLVAPDNVIQIFNAGEILDFKGFVHGMSVDGNDIWFVGKHTGGFVHSSGFADSGTHDLPDLTSTPTTPTPPVVTPPTKPRYSFVADLACVTEVDPAGEGNFEYGNFPAKPLKVVLHDFGTPGRDTFGSTRNTFNVDGYEVSAHFVVSEDIILQMVALKDRAYGAGPKGNDFVQIEIDPTMSEKTKVSVRKLRKELDDYYGYKLEPIEHNQIMATSCGDDVNLADLDPYTVIGTPTAPGTEDPVVVSPTPDPATPNVVTEIKTVVINATVTFVQAFLGAWAATGFNLDKVVLAGMVGAAASLVWNTILKPFLIKKGALKQ